MDLEYLVVILFILQPLYLVHLACTSTNFMGYLPPAIGTRYQITLSIKVKTKTDEKTSANDACTPSQSKEFKSVASNQYFEGLEGIWNEGLKLENMLKF